MRRAVQVVLSLGVVLAATGPSLSAQAATTRTWSGAGPNALWTDPANWVGGQAPGAGDALVFPAGSRQTSAVNDEPSGTPFTSLTLGGDGYTLSGNSISLSQGITMTTPDWTREFVNLGLTFSGSQSVSAGTTLWLGAPVVISNGTLTFASGTTGVTGVVSGGGGIVVGGAGSTELDLKGNNTYSGPTFVRAGATVRAYAAKALGSTVSGTTVAGGGQLLLDHGAIREPITLDTASGVGSPILSSDYQALNLSGPLNLAGSGQVVLRGPSASGWGPPLSIDGRVTGSASVQVTGVVSLTNPKNTLTGAITVGLDPASQVPIDFLGIGASGATGKSSGITINGGGLHLSDTATASAPCVVAAPTTFDGGIVETRFGTADSLTGPVTIASHGAIFAGVSVTGTIGGSGPVYTVTGTTTTFSGRNTFSGDVTLQGTLIAVGDAALGQPTNRVTVASGTYGELELAGMTTLNQNITLFNSGAVPTMRILCSPAGQCGTLTDWGSITVAGGTAGGPIPAIVPDSGETFVVEGALHGDPQQSIALGGGGLVDIPGPQPYQGTLYARHLLVAGNASIANVVGVHPGDLQVNGPQTFSVHVLGGTSPGIENLSGDTTWTGPVQSATVTVDSGSVTFDNVAGDVAKSGPGVLTLTGPAANTNGGPDIVAGGTVFLDKLPQVSAAPGGLVIGGSAQNPSQALVRLLAPGQLGPQANITLLSGGTLDLNAFNDTIGSLTVAGGTLMTESGVLTLGGDLSGQGTVNGHVDLGGSTRTVRVDFASVLRAAGTLSGSGSGILVSNSNGVLVYSAGTQQTYTGATTVAGGLQVDGDLTSSPVTVDYLGTLWGTGSTGSLSGDGTVIPGDGPLAPGANGAQTGNLTVASASLGAYSRLTMLITEPGCATCASRLSVKGSVDLRAAPTLGIVAYQPGVPNGTKFTVVDNQSLLPVLGFFKGLPEGSIFRGGSYTWQITYAGGDGNDVVITALGPAGATTSHAAGRGATAA